MRMGLYIAVICGFLTGWAYGQAPPATSSSAPSGQAKLPFLQIDVKNRRIRVECEAVKADYPLEFFCVITGGNEYEAVLRSGVKPSHLHLAMLMLGLQPGQPVRYAAAAQKWLPPHGPPLHVSVEMMKDGRLETYPAARLMRDIRTKKEMPAMTWTFSGSSVLDDGRYAADLTGNLISVVNNESSVIDIPQLASKAMESRQWESNPDMVPPTGTKVWMVIEPAGGAGAAPPPPPATDATSQPISAVTADQAKLAALRWRWDQQVAPHQAALRQAAQAHYEVISAMRREQQRLVDEADRIQRVIDQLEKEYQNMTTPQPPGDKTDSGGR